MVPGSDHKDRHFYLKDSGADYYLSWNSYYKNWEVSLGELADAHVDAFIYGHVNLQDECLTDNLVVGYWGYWNAAADNWSNAPQGTVDK